MLETVLISVGSSAISAVAAFALTKKFILGRMDLYENEAKAKAKTIEYEAELLLHKTKLEAQEIEFEAKHRYEKELLDEKVKLESHRCDLDKVQSNKLGELKTRENLLIQREKQAVSKLEKSMRECSFNAKQKEDYETKLKELVTVLEKHASMSESEAQKQLIELTKESKRLELAQNLKKIESQDRETLQRKSAYVLAQATTRFAGEFANERLVNKVNLPDNELKGRIIGREGRNIRILENLLGVDIIIDETPNVIELSSHNLYRRAIATKTLEMLIEDGRIQPARIEEIFAKVREQFESQIQTEGENVIAQLGLPAMHPEIARLVGKLRFRASYGQNALAHTLEVAHFSGVIAAELGGDETLAKRAGLLHDIGKAMTHEIGGNHVDIGAEICTRHHEDPVVINAIYAHHDQQEVLSIECAAVCAADALSAGRPGARREVLESYLKRVKEIEEIALVHSGVKQAYAINAGRELRVIINAELLGEAESALVATEIASEIEKSMNYPGEIKVNVIREERFIAVAK